MSDDDVLAERFEQNRPRLRAVAYRMLGSRTEADDAVQEAWLRLSRTGASGVDNLAAWLTTVVGRVCLDMLRSRTARREDPLEAQAVEPAAGAATAASGAADPEQEAVLADSVGLALLIVLESLAPTERLAFVLHDMFAVSFEEIAPIVGRSPAATRQLASRARRRVRDTDAAPDADPSRQREVVEAFLAAARNGDFAALLTVLDPDVVLRGDRVAAAIGGSAELRGADAVASFFAGRAQAARPALVAGSVGLAVIVDGDLRFALEVVVSAGRIIGIETHADREALRELDIELLDS
ncbi:MAG: sigma-70 family RNA polymerase sigma factor [Micromonosporaceae bacterium]|nr:sigma-70 family RNA polymerase sigma factor [Micromonosporaceae bacterium]